MNVSREAVYAALWSAVSTYPAIEAAVKTKSRAFKPLVNLKPEQTPALFMLQGGETAERSNIHTPIKWTLRVIFVLYVDTIGDYSTLAATQANDIMDSLEAALQPSNPQYLQTLNNLVKSVSIEGQVQTNEGLDGPKAIWEVPVSVLVP